MAAADYSQAISLDPLWVDAWNQRGSVWKEQGEYDKAISDYNKVISMSRKYEGAHCKRGILWYELEDYYEASIDLKRALELNPRDKEAKSWLEKAEAKLRESPAKYNLRRSIREQAASFIEKIVNDYGKKFKNHDDGFVNGEEIRHWDPINKCPVRAGITGWLPAFRPDLAKWHHYKSRDGYERWLVITHIDTEFNPEDAGVPIREELWEAISGNGHLFEYDEEFIGKIKKFEKVAPMLTRIAARIRAGDLDEDLIFGDEELN